MSEPRRYARRRINPFLGVIQVIESDDGRALSPDGCNWELQLFAERRVGWGSLGTSTERRLYRYGVWSSAEGLACFPTPPTVSREEARRAAGVLVEAARASLQALPFPLLDRFELWLLDASPAGDPLAMLDAATEAEGMAARRARHWTCATTEAPGLGDAVRTGLEGAVRYRSGQGARSAWFRREGSGEGVELTPGSGAAATAQDGRRLPAGHFPELLLSEQWTEQREQELVERYLAWAAPRLLMLPMRGETRARLERTAAAQSLVVDRFHRLYPEVMDPGLIVRLRVEAQLRRGNEATG
jgi:hypothetical protein